MMTMPDEPEIHPAAMLAQELAEFGENIEPIFESAKGIRNRLESDGWSPTVAEAAAATWLNGALALIWTGAIAQTQASALNPEERNP